MSVIKQTIYILQGLPASGKTTKAKEMVKQSEGKMKRVNKDDLRAMTDSKHSKQREKQILNLRDAIIDAHLIEGYDVVIDDTNLANKHIERITNLFSDRAVIVVDPSLKSVPLETCLERDAKRDNPVGRKVIENMWVQFFIGKGPDIYYPNTLKPAAFVFDIDGTVAEGGHHRSPYDWTAVSKDDPINSVIEILISLNRNQYSLIALSGRDGRSYKDTEEWLKNNNVPFDDLFMRAEGDNRRDSIIKKELFFNNVAPNYNVRGIFDDRDQVVNMWREMGLRCMQVGYGCF